MTAVALIPARGGSKRIPRKNLRLCGGHPMVAWSIRAAIEAGLDAWVSTDSEEIATVATDYGARVIERPAELADDTADLESVIAHAAAVWSVSGVQWDALALLQPTSPLRWAEHVSAAVALVGDSADGVVGVVRMPAAAFRWHGAGDGSEPGYHTRPRTQDITTLVETGALYVVSREAWQAHGRRYGARPHAYVLSGIDGWDIDEEWQLEIADAECWRHQLRRRPRICWPLEESAA